MNIGDVYENRKNPARHVRIVSCVDGKLKADVLGEGGNAIDEMETSEKGFSKHWALFEAAPVPESDPQPAVTLDDGEAPGEVSDAEHQAELVGIPVHPTRISLGYPEPEEQPDETVPRHKLKVQAKGKELRIKCRCGQAALFDDEIDDDVFVAMRNKMLIEHMHCLTDGVQQQLKFGHESVASSANGEAVA